MRNELILVINPGSTSTKVALFEGQKELSQRELRHDAAELKKFAAGTLTEAPVAPKCFDPNFASKSAGEDMFAGM